MKKTNGRLLLLAAIELAVCVAVICTYVSLVPHLLSDWLKELWSHQRDVYALVAIALIIVQAVGLELLLSFLLSLVRQRRR
jgi:hypothetical protein